VQTLLLNLPLANLAMPPLSLPSLTAYLRAQGLDAQQRDLNAELIDVVLSLPYLERAYATIHERVAALDAQPSLTPADAVELALLCGFDMSAPYTLGHIEEALRTLRRKETPIDQREVRAAYEVVDQALLAASHVTRPLRLGRSDLDLPTGFFRRHRSCHDPFWQGLGLTRALQRRIDELMAELEPGLVGLSLLFPSQIPLTLLAAEMVKDVDPGCHVALGGSVVGLMTDLLADELDVFDHVDTLVVHEGEVPLARLAAAIGRGAPLDGLEGTIRRGDDVEDATRSGGEAGVRFSDLPTAVFDGLPLDAYLTRRRTLPLLSSRGCYFRRCTFCNHHLVYGGRYRARGAARVVEDVRTLMARHDTSSFYFCDECMAPAFARRFSDRLLELGLQIDWMTEIRFEEGLTDELIGKMARAGCRYLLFGLESANRRIRGLIDKGTRLRDARRILAACSDNGILTHCFVLAGFPTETAAELQETFDFLVDNGDHIDSIGVATFILERGSPIRQDPERFGVSRVRDRATGQCDFEVEGGRSREELSQHVFEFCYDNDRLHVPLARIDRTNLPYLSSEPGERYAGDSLLVFPLGRLQRRPPPELVCARSPRFGTGRYHHDIVRIGRLIKQLPGRLPYRILNHEPVSDVELAGGGLSEEWRSLARLREPVLFGTHYGQGDTVKLGAGLEVLLEDVDACDSFEELTATWSKLSLQGGSGRVTPEGLVSMLRDIGLFEEREPATKPVSG